MAEIIRMIILGIYCLEASYHDITTKKIPNELSLSVAVCGLCLTMSPKEMGIRLLWCLGLFFLGMFVPLMGMGDLIFFMALICLIGGMPALYGVGIGALLLIFYAFFHNKEESKDTVDIMFKQVIYTKKIQKIEGQTGYAFAPFLSVGAILSILIFKFI